MKIDLCGRLLLTLGLVLTGMLAAGCFGSTPQLVVGGAQAFYPVMVGKQGTDVVGSRGVLYYVTGIDVKVPVLWERPLTIGAG